MISNSKKVDSGWEDDQIISINCDSKKKKLDMVLNHINPDKYHKDFRKDVYEKVTLSFTDVSEVENLPDDISKYLRVEIIGFHVKENKSMKVFQINIDCFNDADHKPIIISCKELKIIKNK